MDDTRDELKRLTQLRLQKWDELSKKDKRSLKRQFPEIYSFFASGFFTHTNQLTRTFSALLADKETLEFADRAV